MYRLYRIWSFFYIIYTCLGSIIEMCCIQNHVITNHVIKRLMCIYPKYSRVRTRISFSFATIFANLIFFVPFSLTLSQILRQILAIFCQRIILSEKSCSFTDSFNCSNRFKSQYNVKCVGGLKVFLALIFKAFAVIN